MTVTENKTYQVYVLVLLYILGKLSNFSESFTNMITLRNDNSLCPIQYLSMLTNFVSSEVKERRFSNMLLYG